MHGLILVICLHFLLYQVYVSSLKRRVVFANYLKLEFGKLDIT